MTFCVAPPVAKLVPKFLSAQLGNGPLGLFTGPADACARDVFRVSKGSWTATLQAALLIHLFKISFYIFDIYRRIFFLKSETNPMPQP
jgi:hypothetical protein